MNLIVALTIFVGAVVFADEPRPAGAQIARPTNDAARPLRFEVASIKQNHSGASGGMRRGGPGQFNLFNFTLRDIIRDAYAVQDSQIIGGPSWISTERFDLQATYSGNGDPRSVAAMTRSLLADRFKLVTREEVRDLPVYALTVARSDRRLGPRLRRAAQDCTVGDGRDAGPPTGRSARDDRPARGRAVVTPRDSAAENRPEARAADRQRFDCGARVGPGVITLRGLPLEMLTREFLSGFVDRTVVNKTNLGGPFDLDLEFRPDTGGMRGRGPSTIAPDDAGVVDRPSLFTALEEQLGLKLETQRAAQPVIVINRVERPTAD